METNDENKILLGATRYYKNAQQQKFNKNNNINI